MKAPIWWLDAIAGSECDGTSTYLWGGPKWKDERIGDAGIKERTFEFEEHTGPFTKGTIFFIRIKESDHMRMCVASSEISIYALGAHLYPMPDCPKFRIVKEVK